MIAAVLESRGDLRRYHTAIPEADIFVVRLCASTPTLKDRVRRREHGTGLDWHLDRAEELAHLMDARGIGDVLIGTDGKPVTAIAREVLDQSGWLAK